MLSNRDNSINDNLYKLRKNIFSGDDGFIRALADSPSFHIEPLAVKVCLRVAQETKYYHWGRRLQAVKILGRNIIGREVIGQSRTINKFILENVLRFKDDENNHVRYAAALWTQKYDEALLDHMNGIKLLEDRAKEESFWKKTCLALRIEKSSLTEYLLVQKNGPYTQKVYDASLELTVVQSVNFFDKR